jgi:hypothetical protein
MILNACFFRPGQPNLAEYFIQPVDYFDFGESTRKVSLHEDMISYIDNTVSMIIVGGSGIHQEGTWLKIRRIADLAAPTLPIVIWGMGINDHHRFDKRDHDTLAHLEGLSNVVIGLRDYFYSTYVPCVSCMRQEFDAHFKIEREFGLYTHLSMPFQDTTAIAGRYTTISNRIHGDAVVNFWKVIKFLASCEVVITNSYHGAYWATLLNKRVVVVSPFSNKFFGMKFEPIIVDDIMFAEQGARLAKSYPDALRDCRARNLEFFTVVRDHAERSRTSGGTPTSIGQ